MHICEYTWDLIQKDVLKFDKSLNDRPGHYLPRFLQRARGSRMGDEPGGQFIIPRNIIKAVANNFHDMAADTIGEATFCCGGGGGLLTDDSDRGARQGRVAPDECLQQRRQDEGVNFLALICAICKAQFTKVVPYYGFDRGQVGGVHQLVSTAIKLD
jgi:hypothetical protein